MAKRKMIVKVREKVPSDIEIAQEANLRPIIEVAKEVGLLEDELDLYGKYKAKVHLSVLERHHHRCERGAGLHWQEGVHLHSPAFSGADFWGADFWNQGRRGWWRLQPDRAHGGL